MKSLNSRLMFLNSNLRGILGPIVEDDRFSHEFHQVYDGTDISTFVRLKRLQWTGHCRWLATVQWHPQEGVQWKYVCI